MPNNWTRTVLENLGGRFQILITPIGRVDRFGRLAGSTRDVTYVRGVPTQLESYSSGDPFGDAVAQLSFPAITGFDDIDSEELNWLVDHANVDIWWIAGESAAGVVLPEVGGDAMRYIDPLTNQADAIAPIGFYFPLEGVPRRGPGYRGIKVWEGFIASQGINSSEGDDVVQVQCQGALYQADRYLQKPFYPSNLQTMESLIAAVFNHARRPHLRVAPLQIAWPAGWAKTAPAYDGQPNIYTANVAPGQKWTGYTSRSTGAWDRSLTGFIQDQIAVMITQPDSGVTPGNQWTVLLARAGEPLSALGRTPVLAVRDRFRAADFAYWYGTPGMAVNLSRDTTQMANLVYGDGTGVDGTVWRNAVIAHDGSRTDYNPLAASPQVYPLDGPSFDPAVFAAEAYQKYGAGFSQPDAVISASQTLQRDADAGWAGTITVKTDPGSAFSRWQIQAGMTMLLKGFRGSGATGLRLHVSQVQASPMTGTVELTVDTRYRDLLNLEEAIARTRDPLTPSKLLQINRNSAIIEDIQAPWDYTAGSGFIPKASKDFYAYAPAQQGFPYSDWSGKHPPFMYPQWYVTCNADAGDRFSRWSGPIPILMSEKGTIARTEIFCCDKYGVPLKIPFHVSIYYVNVPPDFMPQDANGPSPFIANAFTTMDPTTGQPWPANSFHMPQNTAIIVWGNAAQPAGFSPGQYADGVGPTGNQPTGLLEDDAPWSFDLTTNNGNYVLLAAAGTEVASGITVYAEFYAEYSETVYFQGRLYRQPQDK